jgi:DNA polymerase-3 subunit delta
VRLAPSRIAAFLRRPDPEFRAVLLYGPDEGLVRERAEAVARSVCPDLKDPFRVADLTASVLGTDPARLADEASQLSLTGGQRVVRVRGAGDGLAKLFAGFLESTPGEALPRRASCRPVRRSAEPSKRRGRPSRSAAIPIRRASWQW